MISKSLMSRYCPDYPVSAADRALASTHSAYVHGAGITATGQDIPAAASIGGLGPWGTGMSAFREHAQTQGS